MSCKNKGCTGHARRGQFFCYDCYGAWRRGGDGAVAKRIAEMQHGEQELADLRLTLTRIKELVLGPKEFMGKPVGRDYSDLAMWDRLGRDKQLLVKLRRAHRDATGANPKGLSLAERNDRLWAWLEAQLAEANKPRPIVLETLRFDALGRPSHGPQCYGLSGCPMVVTKLCKHPSAKTTDEAEPLRRRVAELEGRLAFKDHQPVVGAGGLYAMALVAFTGLGAVLGFLLK